MERSVGGKFDESAEGLGIGGLVTPGKEPGHKVDGNWGVRGGLKAAEATEHAFSRTGGGLGKIG